MFRVVESFVAAKARDRLSEDILVVTDHFVAVIDGASDSSGARFAGRSAGRFAAEVIAAEIRATRADVTALQFAEALTAVLASSVQRCGGTLDAAERWPAASIVCLATHAREVWRVGDCHAVIDGIVHLGEKRVDDAAYSFRAVVNAALMARGMPLKEILRLDPGQVAARPLFDLQQHLANRAGPWGYGAINGREVPGEYLDVFAVPAGGCEVILASDGYPIVLETLTSSETRLQELLIKDPASVGELWRLGKGVRPGDDAPDDRAYVRLHLDALT